MEDLTWEAQIGRVRKEYEDEMTALRARIEELEAEVARLRDAVLDQIAEIDES
jgi:cell division protein FtsB